MKRRGFTLIEIMIVLAIVSTLATLAIVSMLRSRLNANEVSAIATLRVISNGSQSYYAATSSPHTYPSSLVDLGAPNSDPSYVDDKVASGQKQGYNFQFNLIDPDHFTCNAEPIAYSRTGNRSFFVNETGRITGKDPGPALPTDPPVE